MKLKLYLDFDGVILNTSHITDRKLKELNITNEKEIEKYHRNIDWNSLMEETEQIKDSISNIKKIIDSNLYDVEILTHINSELEKTLKKEYIESYLPGTNVIAVYKEIDKCDAVNPKNCILVDDYKENLIKWHNKGGIPIKFSDNHKSCEFITIDNLSQMIDIYDELNCKFLKEQVVNDK